MTGCIDPPLHKTVRLGLAQLVVPHGTGGTQGLVIRGLGGSLVGTLFGHLTSRPFCNRGEDSSSHIGHIHSEEQGSVHDRGACNMGPEQGPVLI